MNRLQRFRYNLQYKGRLFWWQFMGKKDDPLYLKIQMVGSHKTRESTELHPYILAAIHFFIECVPDRAAKILDAGCGDGWTLDQFKKANYTNLQGLDLNEEKLQTAKHFGDHTVTRALLPDIPFSDHSFNAIYCRDVFEHLLFPEKTLESFYRVLSDGGKLCLVVTKTGVGLDYSEAHAWEVKHLGQIAKMLEKAGFSISFSKEVMQRESEFWFFAEKNAKKNIPSSAAEKNDAGIRKKTVKSLGAVGLIQVSKKIITTIISIALYRYLSAYDFGLFALCESYLMVAVIFSDFGLEDALLQIQSGSPAALIRTGYTVKTFFTLVTFSILFCATPFLAASAHAPAMIDPLRFVSLSLLTNLVVFPTEIFFKKGIRFDRLMGPEIFSQLAASLLAFVLAMLHYGYWSLVGSVLLGQILRTFLFLITQNQTLSWGWDPFIVKEIWHKSRYSFLVGILYFVLARALNFFIASSQSLANVGIFYLAFNWSNFFVVQIAQFSSRVLFPAVAAMEFNRQRIVKTYGEYLHRLAFFGLPFNAALVFLAPVVIPLALGKKWESAVPYCQILCIHGALRTLVSPALTVLYGMGRFKQIFKSLMVELVSLVGFFFAFKSWGLEGACWALVLSKAIGFIVPVMIANCEFKEFKLKSLEILIPYLLASALMVLSMVGADAFLAKFSFIRLRLIIESVLGISVYLMGYYLFHGKKLANLTSIWDDLKLIWGKAPQESMKS